ncbi:4Fe-4S binding protein [Pseudomonas jinjuensis]|uniref:4Fe-4S binding domain-containing protein n=1 Tax=Pseudomonas jinjuensis TaxID=198616 RepID=A0A1H0FAI8_9PSED|nr:4Fe-4S binding protein [Pseudomonas jinjuensis]SDN91621.1 4Fe-4S binding domain-containing protein [Pseudomonas jinjuensis]
MSALAAGLARLGDGMRRHARLIRAIQWLIVLFYALLLVIPAFLDLPDRQARILTDLGLFAQFVFWGIWWPFVLLSMVLFGRLWCGVFCPEGALSEWASRHGRGRGVPRWMRWGGWPFVAFGLTTLYGQLVSVYDYAWPALLILGGSTVAAMLVGFLYGRGKRVWCRYLCPVSGVFGLLARLAPVHFRVDEERWQANCGPHLPPPNCAPLIDIRRMKGNSACHACGRCSGQRGAVALSPRWPNEEIVVHGQSTENRWPVRLLLFGMIGLAMGAFNWTLSPWFIALKQTSAEWLVERGIVWPLEANAPWWLLTHYPQNNDAFTWLDGGVLVFYVLAWALLMGGWLMALLRLACRVSGQGRALYTQLAQALIPLGGCGLFLGLSATTVKLLRYEGLALAWVQPARALLLAGAGAWALWLGWRIVRRRGVAPLRQPAVLMCLALACAPVLGGWWLMFWGWN